MLVDSHEQSIAIAINRYGADVLAIPRGLALLPIFLAAATPKPGSPSLQRSLDGLSIHVGNHQYGRVAHILHYDNNEAISVILQSSQEISVYPV